MRINKPLEKKVALAHNPEDWVVIRQATQGDVEALADYTSETRRVLRDDDSLELVNRFSYPERQRQEAFRVLAGSSIFIEDESGEDGQRPLFEFKTKGGVTRTSMTEEEFTAAWGLLPGELAQDIHEAILDVNPQWDPNPQSRKKSKKK